MPKIVYSLDRETKASTLDAGIKACFGNQQHADVKSDSYFSEEMSSEKFKAAVYVAGEHPDFWYTYVFRFFRLTADWLNSHNIVHPDTEGITIDFAAQHPVFLILFTALILFIAGIGWVYQRAKDQFQTDLNKNEFSKQLNQPAEAMAVPPEAANPITTEELEHQLIYWNEKLEGLVKKPQFKQFRNAKITAEEGKLVLTYDRPTRLRMTWNMLCALWEAVCLGSFMYWLSWIMIGTAVGSLTLPLGGFIFPIVVGLIYLGIKAFHFYKHSKEDAKPTLPTHVSANALMKECLSADQEENDTAPQPVPDFKKRVFGAGLIAMVNRYLIAQYVLWFVSDFLLIALGTACAVPVVNVLAWAIFAFAIGAGIRAAYVKYYELKSQTSTQQQVDEKKIGIDINDPRSIPLLERSALASDAIQSQTVHSATSDLMEEEEEKPLTVEEKIQRIKDALIEDENPLEKLVRWYAACHDSAVFFGLSQAMSAAFIARIFTLPITSPFIPSMFHIITAVAILSQPTTLIIIGSAGLVWAGIRLYLRHLENKAADARPEAEKIAAKETELSVWKQRLAEKAKDAKANPRCALRYYAMFKKQKSADAPEPAPEVVDVIQSAPSQCEVRPQPQPSRFGVFGTKVRSAYESVSRGIHSFSPAVNPMTP